jgi:uncharacterized protein
MTTEAVQLTWTDGCNIIVGQAHFIKTVDDVAEIVAGSVPGVQFGLAFCEASGPCLIRTEGNDEQLVRDAISCAQTAASGHTFYLILRNAYPINVLNALKSCAEIVAFFAATANPLQLVIAQTEQGRGIIGVIDGAPPKGVESDSDKHDRKDLMRRFGYTFS